MVAREWSTAERKKFRSGLLHWFALHRRDLPWRRTRDPYHIWVSEIMLQQTRVAAVMEHYAVFLLQFPTVKALADAPEADVLAVWSGLGYYRRARMLRRGAQAVVEACGSMVPGTAAELIQLPGIGAYTSAAIASIAFGEAVAVVDGNVERVITRLARLAENNRLTAKERGLHKRIHQLAAELLDPDQPGDFNQAMMELGATLCLPRNPLCRACPVAKLCQTRGPHPVSPRKSMVRRDAAYAMVVITAPPRGMQVLLQQRPVEGTVMAGMWELPELDGDALDGEAAEMVVRHAIMQTNYVVQIHSMSRREMHRHRLHDRVESWVALESLSRMPLTGLARKVLRRAGVMLPSPTR